MLTRALFGYDGDRCTVARVTVIANHDATGGHPAEIAKSLAYERENVADVCNQSRSRPSCDSPPARRTRARVAAEPGV